MLLSGHSSPADALRFWNDPCFGFQWRSPRKRDTCGKLIDVSACAKECIKRTEGQSSTHHRWGRSPSINTPGFPSVWYRLKCLYFLLLLTVNQGQLLIVEISLDIIVLLFLISYTCKTKRIVVSIEMIFVFWLIRI